MPSFNSPALKEDRAHGSRSFRCAFYTVDPSDTRFHASLHWHEELEIIYFKKGTFILEINLEQYTIQEECLFFVNSGELHRIVCDEPCQESAVVFSPYLLNFVTSDTAQSEVLLPLAKQNLLLPRCIPAAHPAFSDVLTEYQRLIRCFTEHPDAAFEKSTQLFIKAALLNILGHLSGQDLLFTAKSAHNESVEGIKTVLSYIHEHYSEKIFIRDLASLVNLNEQYFCRFFKKTIGTSPIAYLNEYRIHRAMELLVSTSLPVTEICLECGFNNVGNFLREFRQQTGSTPLKYRKNHSEQKSK